MQQIAQSTAPQSGREDRHQGASTGNTRSTSNGYRGPLGWWYRSTMPSEPASISPIVLRERYRRSRIATALLFIFVVGTMGALPLGLQNLPTLVALCTALVTSVIAVILNRTGHVFAVGILLSTLVEIVLVAVLLSGPRFQIDVDYLQLYYLLLLPELSAIALLPPWTVFFSRW